jgi:hypothetical protein
MPVKASLTHLADRYPVARHAPKPRRWNGVGVEG